ncbi:MAG: methyltransferase domain-containing protein [Sedimentisphaerales bacterium]|nr:methyltransferase domain-containing protein [Sedimentisphaerales bacterium]
MNVRRGFQRITLVVSIAAALYCAVWVGRTAVRKHETAWQNMQWRQTMVKQERSFTTIEEGFWGRLSTGGLVVICIVGGAAGAVVGYYVVWVAHRFLEWIVLGFCSFTGELGGKRHAFELQQWDKEKLLTASDAYKPVCLLKATTDLDIFGKLKGSSMTAEAIAIELSADQRAMGILLDALAALGLLVKEANSYRLHPAVTELVAEKEGASVLAAVRHRLSSIGRWEQLAEIVRSGKPVRTAAGIRGEAADRVDFLEAMREFAEPVVYQIIEKMLPLKFNHLLDVGGGLGTWTAAFLQAVPNAKATLFDLPEAINMAQEHIAKARLSDRVSFVSGDFHNDELPSGVDFAWLSAIAHQNSREQNRLLFRKVRESLTDNGIAVLRDVVMDKTRISPKAGAIFAVNMLVCTENGCTYTFDEFSEDLTGAGFKEVTLIQQDEFMNSLIRARK